MSLDEFAETEFKKQKKKGLLHKVLETGKNVTRKVGRAATVTAVSAALILGSASAYADGPKRKVEVKKVNGVTPAAKVIYKNGNREIEVTKANEKRVKKNVGDSILELIRSKYNNKAERDAMRPIVRGNHKKFLGLAKNSKTRKQLIVQPVYDKGFELFQDKNGDGIRQPNKEPKLRHYKSGRLFTEVGYFTIKFNDSNDPNFQLEVTDRYTCLPNEIRKACEDRIKRESTLIKKINGGETTVTRSVPSGYLRTSLGAGIATHPGYGGLLIAGVLDATWQPYGRNYALGAEVIGMGNSNLGDLVEKEGEDTPGQHPSLKSATLRHPQNYQDETLAAGGGAGFVFEYYPGDSWFGFNLKAGGLVSKLQTIRTENSATEVNGVVNPETRKPDESVLRDITFVTPYVGGGISAMLGDSVFLKADGRALIFPTRGVYWMVTGNLGAKF